MESKRSSDDQQLHIVMFPFFAFGHISPFVQLSNKLSAHNIKITFLSAPGNISRIKTTLKLTPQAEIIPLQLPQVDGLPPNLQSTSDMTPAMGELLKQSLDLMQPQILTLLSQLNPHFVFFDFAQHWLPKLVSEIGVKTVKFSVFSAVSEAYMMVPARKNEEDVSDIMRPPVGFPSTGVKSLQEFQARNFCYVRKRFGGMPSVYEREMECYDGCSAVVIKTCNEIEGPYVHFLRSQFRTPILLSGPLIPKPASGELEQKWEVWLSQFPEKSVIYCSFGSETFLNKEQINELTLGLELTGLPFFLVLNFPDKSEIDNSLPKGFIERVKNRGVVHTGWVQQQLILAHKSVGCYMFHSGYSSIIEGLINDCQLVLLPFKGDQFLNAKLVSGDMKAGVEVKRRNEDGYFGKEDVMEAVKTVMVDVDKEPGAIILQQHKKWREFLLNGDVDDKYIVDLVERLKDLA